MNERARALIEAAYWAAVEEVDPLIAVLDTIDMFDGYALFDGTRVELPAGVVVVAIGKAAVTMTQGAVQALGDEITSGIAITKDGHSGDASFDMIEIHEASHPIPDRRGVEATQRAIEIVESADRDAVVLCLISGGGSALFEAPRPPVTLDDLAEVTRLMLRAGATIDELNQVRRPLSLVKGGGFLNAIGSRTVVTLILSDVLGNDLSTIASGPTVPSHDSPGAALARLDQFGLTDKVPESVITVLSSEQEGRQTRPELFLSAVVADNRDAIHGARTSLESNGLTEEARWIDVEGEAREMGRLWADECSRCPDAIDALVGGGEMTVTVTGDGVGGRNTEFALAAAMRLRELGNRDWLVASLATDGQDGPTGVAGAILGADDIDQMIEAGIDLDSVLAENDSLIPLRAVGADFETGPTGTNANDIYLAIRVSAVNASDAGSV